MIVIRCEVLLSMKAMGKLYDEMTEQAKRGLILLPEGCFLQAVTGDDRSVVIVPCGDERMVAK